MPVRQFPNGKFIIGGMAVKPVMSVLLSDGTKGFDHWRTENLPVLPYGYGNF